MEFFTRLLNQTPLSAVSKRDQAKDPARRLHKFEREYGTLLQTWRNSSNLAYDPDAAERLEINLQFLTSMLQDETRLPLPHPCIQFAALKQMYVPVGKMALTSHSEWLVKEAVLFFAALVESEEEAFVENKIFSESLTNLLVRITGANGVRLGQVTEARVVELAFNVTTKIRLCPEILPAWFSVDDGDYGHGGPVAPARTDLRPRDRRERFAGRTQRKDFPLFYILIDYIHQEGKIGDFARTGLLYIIEAASSSVELEQWIVESDLSTLMATGLGALYSQLSRKLVIAPPSDMFPPVLAFSDYERPPLGYEVVGSFSPEFLSHLDTFLSHMLFWQDVLNHCKSTEIKQTLLEHFQVIFLQQLLYPSLLESSDIDGGSSVAVLTYLRRILESLDHPDMIHLILHYLLALPDTAAPDPSGEAGDQQSISAARKRKSLDLLTMMASQTDDASAPTPLLFNLVDLILACLRSHNHQTIHVTLQLLSVILRRHHRYAVSTLLRTTPISGTNHRRTVGAHAQEVEYLTTLATEIGGQDDFEEMYETIVKDTTARIETHQCSLKLVAPRLSTSNHDLPALPDALPGAPKDVGPHTIRSSDPLLKVMLDHLETFLLNPVDTNLSLTDTMIDLAVCGYMSLEGWMARSPHLYVYDEADGAEGGDDVAQPGMAQPGMDDAADAELPDRDSDSEHSRLVAKCRRRPQWASSLPRLFVVLRSLCDQLETYRAMVPRWDELLQHRREQFHVVDAAQTPLVTPSPNPPPQPFPPRKPSVHDALTPERRPEYASRSGSPPRGISALEGFAQRIFNELTTPSRSGSPKGRRERAASSASQTSSLVPTSQGMPASFVSSPTPRGRLGAPDPRHELSPSGRSSPGMPPSTSGSPAPRNKVVPSQMTAFREIDTRILSRRLEPLKKRQGKEADADEKEEEEQAHDVVLPSDIPQAKQDVDVKLVDNTTAYTSLDEQPPATNETDTGGAQQELMTTKPQAAAAEADQVVQQAPIVIEPENAEERTPRPEPAALQNTEEEEALASQDTASVSHVMTNAILLQSFMFELSAVLQVRASLFGEVRFV